MSQPDTTRPRKSYTPVEARHKGQDRCAGKKRCSWDVDFTMFHECKEKPGHEGAHKCRIEGCDYEWTYTTRRDRDN